MRDGLHLKYSVFVWIQRKLHGRQEGHPEIVCVCVLSFHSIFNFFFLSVVFRAISLLWYSASCIGSSASTTLATAAAAAATNIFYAIELHIFVRYICTRFFAMAIAREREREKKNRLHETSNLYQTKIRGRNNTIPEKKSRKQEKKYVNENSSNENSTSIRHMHAPHSARTWKE